jgi:hypothetical protein
MKNFHCCARHLVGAAALSLLALVAGAGCKASGPKNFLSSQWDAFETLNPTDIVVARVTGPGLSTDVDFDALREAVHDQLLNHRYSPLSFDYVDSGKSVLPASAAPATAGAAEADHAKAPGAVARVRLVMKEFDFRRYDIRNSMKLVGEFQFLDAAGDRVLATVVSDQDIDLGEEARNGADLKSAMRAASRKFVEISLRSMPDRRVLKGQPAKN